MISCSDSLPESISYQTKFTLNVVSVPKEVMWEESEKRKNVNRLTSVRGNLLYCSYQESIMWGMSLLLTRL